jgi:hypothetical protein
MVLELDPRLRVRIRQDRLTALVYELLDAHDDTARLAAEQPPGADPSSDLRWQAHLAYLRDLQRVGRGMLARDAA